MLKTTISKRHQKSTLILGLTETKHDVEKYDTETRHGVDKVPVLAHPKRSWRHILAASDHVWEDGEKVAGRGQNDKGAGQIGKSSLGAELDGAKGTAEYGGKNGRFDGARQLLVDSSKHASEWSCVVTSQSPENTADCQKGSNAADQDGEEDDDEEAKGATCAAGCLVVDLGKRERAIGCQDGIQICDGVKNGDGVEERGDGSEDNLSSNSLGQVTFWVGQLLGHVCHSVWCSNGECSVEHTGQEGHSAAPASLIVPHPPDKVGCCVLLGHGRDDDDGDDSTNHDQDQSDTLHSGQKLIAKDAGSACKPGDAEERDVIVPWLDDERWMKDGIQLD